MPVILFYFHPQFSRSLNVIPSSLTRTTFQDFWIFFSNETKGLEGTAYQGRGLLYNNLLVYFVFRSNLLHPEDGFSKFFVHNYKVSQNNRP